MPAVQRLLPQGCLSCPSRYWQVRLTPTPILQTIHEASAGAIETRSRLGHGLFEKLAQVVRVEKGISEDVIGKITERVAVKDAPRESSARVTAGQRFALADQLPRSTTSR
jgi:hypothetical protein